MIEVGYVPYIGHYTPYISRTNTSNTVIQTKEFTKEEIYIAGTFTFVLCIKIIIFLIYIIKEFIKYSK